MNRHAKNPLEIEWESWSEERERELESGFSLLTPGAGGQKRTRLLPFLRVKSSDFFDLNVDVVD